MRSNIEAERARMGLSRTQLAEKLDVSRQTLWVYINDGSIPMEKLIAMRNLFGVSIDYLLGLSPTP